MKFHVESVLETNTTTGKTYKKAALMGEDGVQHQVSVWSDYSNYAAVTQGNTVEGVIRDSGKYKNLVSGNLGTRPASIPAKFGAVMQIKQEGIRQAQENKGEAIKISSTMRDAVLITLAELGGNQDHETYESRIRYWRSWLYAEWEEVKDVPPFN